MREANRCRREISFPIGAAASLEELVFDPHPLLSRLREREPVSWLPALGGWLVTRRDLALQAMRRPATFTVEDPRFSTGRVVGTSMLSLDGAEHRRHRDPFARPFRLDAVRRRFTEVVEAETERLIDAIEPEARADLRRSLTGPLAATVVADALGLARTDTAQILGWYDAIVEAVTGVAAAEPVKPVAKEAFEALRSSVEPSLDRDPSSRGRRREPGRPPDAFRGRLERRSAHVRRHRDDRGNDRERNPPPAPPSRPACAHRR